MFMVWEGKCIVDEKIKYELEIQSWYSVFPKSSFQIHPNQNTSSDVNALLAFPVAVEDGVKTCIP